MAEGRNAHPTCAIFLSVTLDLHWSFPGRAFSGFHGGFFSARSVRAGENTGHAPYHPISTLLHLRLSPKTYPWGRIGHRTTNLDEQLLLLCEDD